MLVLMNVQATPEQIANVIKHVRERGFEPIELPGSAISPGWWTRSR
jgi:hypothetical protein